MGLPLLIGAISGIDCFCAIGAGLYDAPTTGGDAVVDGAAGNSWLRLASDAVRPTYI